MSTQRPAEQRAFARHNKIQFPLFSDADLELTTALRLPTVRVGGSPRIHRLMLVVDRNRVVRRVLHPITDATGSVEGASSTPVSALAFSTADQERRSIAVSVGAAPSPSPRHASAAGSLAPSRNRHRRRPRQ